MANEIPDTLSSVDYATLTEQLRDIISRLDTIYRLGGDNPVMDRIDAGVDRIDAGVDRIDARLFNIDSRLTAMRNSLRNSDRIYRLGGDNPVMSRIDVGVDRIDAGASGIAARLFNIDSRLTAMRNSLRNSDRINGYGHYWD